MEYLPSVEKAYNYLNHKILQAARKTIQKTINGGLKNVKKKEIYYDYHIKNNIDENKTIK